MVELKSRSEQTKEADLEQKECKNENNQILISSNPRIIESYETSSATSKECGEFICIRNQRF